MLTGENGILTQAWKAKEQTEIESEKEQIQLAYIENQTSNLGTITTSADLKDTLEDNKIKTEAIYGDSEQGLIIILENKNIYEIDSNGKIEYKGTKITLSDDEPKMMARDDNYAFWQSDYRTKITKIETKPYITKLNNVKAEWSMSSEFELDTDERKKTVMAYLLDDGNNGYELYIMSNGKTILNSYAFSLFKNFSDLKTINLSGFDAKDVQNMNMIFSSCGNLEEISLGLNSPKLTTIQFGFSGCTKLKKVNLNNFITDNLVHMGGMFMRCENLTNIDISCINTSKVENMEQMFEHCTNLKSINIGNTNKVHYMGFMFNCCYSLEYLDLRGVITDNVTDMNSMFASCTNLKKLDISNFDTNNVTDMSYMFKDCINLTSISVGPNWTKANAKVDGMFERCNITI